MQRVGKDIELKPCPFCGGTQIQYVTYSAWPAAGHKLFCNGCNVVMHGISKEDVYAKWNRRYEQPNTQLTTDDMMKINRYTRRAYGPEEVYTFSLVLCDNEIDRDYERFSVESLEKLRELFLGKTCIFDHECKSANQTARIYDTRLEEVAGETTQAGETLTRLAARAYLPRTGENRETIDLIDSSILKEVSVSCSVARAICSICGGKNCRHEKGHTYGGKLCHRILTGPTVAYECAFVVKPYQKRKGLETIYQTPESCPHCMEHLSRDWSFCPECGRPTDWSKNEPLTLSELRQMEGEPVWIECELWAEGRWMIITTVDLDHLWMHGRNTVCMDMEVYGEAWQAYRRRPEGGVK